MKKPALKTPAQAMLDRYHKIQVEWAGLCSVKQLYYLLIFFVCFYWDKIAEVLRRFSISIRQRWLNNGRKNATTD
jgi:hypothetical protein